MLYQRKSFTVPTANIKTTNRQWDCAMLPRAEFLAKYGADAPEYAPQVKADEVPATV